MHKIAKGDWVQICRVVLPAGERAPQVPDDTKKCDLIMWVKGFAASEARMGENLDIITITGRHERGLLCGVNPAYTHGFGDFQPELLQVSMQLKKLLVEADEDK